MTDRHLNDEALNDLLIGLGTTSAQAHLARCPECRVRVESFRETIVFFNDASLAWSENRVRSGTVRVSFAPRLRFALLSRPALSFGVALAALLLLAGPPVWRMVAPRPVEPSPTSSEAVDYRAQIAEDNELMRAVNSAIDPDMHSVVDQYYLLNGRPAADPKTRTE